ncbi:hypothetical protein DMUE_0390 [Dictyocoela muelleri]|nr:hypothetical protein DMUE_0390 [Dictyocoela muelleri]
MEEITKQFQFLYNLPKYDKQMEFIDGMGINHKNANVYLEYLDKIFKQIPTNRRDKFFYMLKRIAQNASISCFYNINNLEIRNYFLKIFIESARLKELNNDEKEKLIKFVNEIGYLSTKEIISGQE